MLQAAGGCIVFSGYSFAIKNELFRLSRNLLWVILYLYDTFHAEISYPKAVLPLISYLLFFLLLFYHVLLSLKRIKRSQHRTKSVVTSFCSRVASDIPRWPGTSTLLCKAKISVVANIAHPQWCHSMLVAVIHALRDLCASAL